MFANRPLAGVPIKQQFDQDQLSNVERPFAASPQNALHLPTQVTKCFQAGGAAPVSAVLIVQATPQSSALTS